MTCWNIIQVCQFEQYISRAAKHFSSKKTPFSSRPVVSITLSEQELTDFATRLLDFTLSPLHYSEHLCEQARENPLQPTTDICHALQEDRQVTEDPLAKPPARGVVKKLCSCKGSLRKSFKSQSLTVMLGQENGALHLHEEAEETSLLSPVSNSDSILHSRTTAAMFHQQTNKGLQLRNQQGCELGHVFVFISSY